MLNTGLAVDSNDTEILDSAITEASSILHFPVRFLVQLRFGLGLPAFLFFFFIPLAIQNFLTSIANRHLKLSYRLPQHDQETDCERSRTEHLHLKVTAQHLHSRP